MMGILEKRPNIGNNFNFFDKIREIPKFEISYNFLLNIREESNELSEMDVNAFHLVSILRCCRITIPCKFRVL